MKPYFSIFFPLSEIGGDVSSRISLCISIESEISM
jgi:hypothetical protein